MKKEKKITKADNILSLIELNKKKQNILNQMKKLEYHHKENTSEFIDLITVYEIICATINKKLLSINEKEKNELMEIITSFNEKKEITSFQKLIEYGSQEIVIKRTIVDLGAKLLILFKNDNRKNNMINQIYNFFGIYEDEEKQELNEELINDFMVSDFNNTILSNVLKRLENTTKISERKQLLDFKYNLLFLSPNLEERALRNKFLIQTKPSLVSEISIETTGLTSTYYLDYIDSLMANWLDLTIQSVLNKLVMNKNTKLELIDLIFIESYIDLLTDKEICDVISLGYLENTNENLKETIDIINEKLMNANTTTDQEKIRKYPTI